jgi:TonB family protein
MTNSRFCWLFCIVASILVRTSAAQEPPTPQQLIDVANAASDLSQIGPYKLDADVAVNPSSGSTATGHIVIYGDKDRWRSELQIGDYHETRLRLGDKLYILRSAFSPVFAFSVARIVNLDRIWRIRLSSDGKLAQVSSKKLDGTPVNCFREKRKFYQEEFCFDPTGPLVRRQDTTGEQADFREYRTLEGIQFPASVALHGQSLLRNVVLQNVQVQKLQVAEDTFAVPVGAREFGGCDQQQGGKLLKRAEPRFPDSEKSKGTGTVYVYGVLEQDGSFTNARVYSPSGTAFEQAVKAVIPTWKFAPASCTGRPVATEISIQLEMSRQ